MNGATIVRALRTPVAQATVTVSAAAIFGVMQVTSGGTIALLAPALLAPMVLAVLVRSLIHWDDDPSAQRRLLTWTMLSFALHILFALALNDVSATLAQAFAGDSVGYHNTALAIYRHWTEALPIPFVPSGKEGFYYLLAGVYWLLGPHRSAGLVVNAALAAALVPVVSDTARRLYGAAAARYVAPLVVLLPGIFFFTSQLLKEASVLMCVAAAANFATRLVKRTGPPALVGLATAMILLFTFRSYVALVMTVGFVAAIFIGKGVISGVGTAVAAAGLVAVLLSVGIGSSGYDTAVGADLEQASVVHKGLQQGANSKFGAGADIATAGGALSYLPSGLANFALGPFPWQIRGVRQLPAVPDVLAWWLLLPALWQGLRKSLRRIGRRTLVLLLPALMSTIVLTLSLSNFGIVVRERMQVVILLVPLISLGLAERAARRAARHTPATLAEGPYLARGAMSR